MEQNTLRFIVTSVFIFACVVFWSCERNTYRLNQIDEFCWEISFPDLKYSITNISDPEDSVLSYRKEYFFYLCSDRRIFIENLGVNKQPKKALMVCFRDSVSRDTLDVIAKELVRNQ